MVKKNIFKAYYSTCMLDRVARDQNSKLQLNSSGNLSKSHVFPKETRAEAEAGERLCVTCAGERRKVPACTFLVLMRLSYKSASVSKEDNGKGQKLIRLAFN